MPLIRVDSDESGLTLTWTLSVSVEQTWDLLTDPERLATWLGNVVDGQIAPESAFTVDHGDGIHCRSTVLKYARPQTMRWTWEFPDEPPTDIEWELEASGGGTRLTLKHSLPFDLTDSYRNGWPVHLTYLEAASLGQPLTPAMFWNLHATMSRIADTRDGTTLLDRDR